MVLPYFSPRARVRIAEILDQAEPGYPRRAGLIANEELAGGRFFPIFDGAVTMLRRIRGIDLAEAYGVWSIRDVCQHRDSDALANFLPAAWAYLVHVEQQSGGRAAPVPAATFERAINQVLEGDQSTLRLVRGEWKESIITEVEGLTRALLVDDSDVAPCRQGDVQVEMVASTVQATLSKVGSVLIDYGAGLGRVLAGLASAAKFQASEYVAVEEPIPESVERLAKESGVTARMLTRREFQTSHELGDVIMVVNTLHHIPFSDIPRQFANLLSRVKPGGFLLVHEMGRFPSPEQLNVPWRVEDLLGLFANLPVDTNPRTTESRGRKIPLANVIIAPSEQIDPEKVAQVLEANVRVVWKRMKDRAVDTIRNLYSTKDPERHADLMEALYVNANLDLNPPP